MLLYVIFHSEQKKLIQGCGWNTPKKRTRGNLDLSWTTHISFEESILMNTLETYIQGSNMFKFYSNPQNTFKKSWNLEMITEISSVHKLYQLYTYQTEHFVARSPSSFRRDFAPQLDPLTKSSKNMFFWVGARKETKKCLQNIGKLELVAGFNQPLWKMMDFVKWDDDIIWHSQLIWNGKSFIKFHGSKQTTSISIGKFEGINGYWKIRSYSHQITM